MNARYYAQRKSAAFIVSEATQVSQQGQGYAWTPGIHSLDQVEGWRLVTEAVHKVGGLIFMQMWHVGRISHPSLPIGPQKEIPVGGIPEVPGATPGKYSALGMEYFPVFLVIHYVRVVRLASGAPALSPTLSPTQLTR